MVLVRTQVHKLLELRNLIVRAASREGLLDLHKMPLKTSLT
jgi:hypothetical protein